MDDLDYLSISAFALKSGVQRKTLIYYDQIDLLKPQKVNEKGYRFYHYHQLYQINMIRFLKDIGLSLKEIKAYMLTKSPEKIIDLLNEQKLLVAKKQDYYNNLSQMIDLQIHSLSQNIIPDATELSVVHYERVPLLFSPIKKKAPNFRSSESITEFYRYCFSKGYDFPYPMGLMDSDIDISTFPAHTKVSFYAKVPESEDCRPKGNYLVKYIRGYKQQQQAYKEMAAYAAANNWKIVGDLYIDFIANELISADFDHFLNKMMLQVEKK
ncbi:MerR family transcriptional regulator [Candidatus Enterococcus ferrettii]|uniref:HTH merR-type domain-containing protein n=1 Tax=Candidatus Enterococcus ferrettii TaxID=2815324 RepID=A0ABV0EPG5_9ENTE|nr:MerR family transcriptional regulator [Enterococcus sp. 665A]MBO1343127.1 MerR family transcriptional regulator [Enterococcus sp. 665A]